MAARFLPTGILFPLVAGSTLGQAIEKETTETGGQQ